jgi:DNA-binding transcriptional ArsR family regulator
MGEWNIPSDVLAGSRFAVSPLEETVSAIVSLHSGGVVPGLRIWAAEHRPVFRGHLARDAFARQFIEAAFRPTSIADFIVTPPARTDRTFHDEVRRVRETPAAVAIADLAKALGGSVPSVLAVPDLPERAAELMEWVWTHTVRPDWPRRQRLFEADIVARTHALSTKGWAAALEGLRPGLRWLGDGRLRINAYANPPRDLAGAELMFIPTTASGRGWVCWDEPARYAVVYPCAGSLADTRGNAHPQALGRLLGPARASVLSQLEAPLSTSQLVVLTGFGLGSVGGHLKILLDAGLVRRTRSGRSVLYYRTALGDTLVRSAMRLGSTGGQTG